MIGRLRRFLSLPSLQRRIGFLTGVAVAVAVALTGIAGYVTAHVSLYNQLDAELIRVASMTADAMAGDFSTAAGISEQSLRSVNLSMVVLRSTGQPHSAPKGPAVLVIESDERALARQQVGVSRRTGKAAGGERYRIVAVPMHSMQGKFALVMGKPLEPTDQILRQLRLVLLVVGSIGAVVGAIIGALIARSSMRPIRRLTRAVTRVTQTDVLDPIEVRGKDELSQLTRSFNTMLYSLAGSRSRQNQLIADAGHELRTPLTSLRTNIELLVADEKSGMLPPGARSEILRDIAAQLAEFTSLIGDLVQLTRDQVRASTAPLNLRDVVNAALERVRLRGQGLDFDVELNSLYLVGEADTLERAVTNLLDNAVKFSPPGGTIRIQLEGDQLKISDQGPGIAEDDLPHVFDRFFRSEKARNTPGTGLGLSIVAQIAARHGGWVRASRSSEGGALFTLRLPGRTTMEALQAELRDYDEGLD